MKSTDWSMYRCNNAECPQVGHDLRVAIGIEKPLCSVCSTPLLAPKLTEEMKTFQDDPDSEATDMIKVNPGPAIECDMKPEELDDVDEWNRCREGIDIAEISLKGFCDQIGADIIKGRIQEICRELRDLVHYHYGLGD